MTHQALLQFSRKRANTSVTHSSTVGTVDCNMFRFVRNHHQVIHTKHLKHFTRWMLKKNMKKWGFPNILYELSNDDS